VQGELIKQGFSAKAAKEILTEVGDNVEVGLRLEYALKILPEYEKKSSVKNKQGFLRKAILEDWRKNDIKSKNAMNISAASKEKNNMALNNLDAEKAKLQDRIDLANDAMKATGITAADLQGEETPMAKIAVDMLRAQLQKGENLTAEAANFLKIFKFTPERFKQVYMTNYQEGSENASTANFERSTQGFNSLGNIFANRTF